MQITNKCLPSILKLQHLEDLILEGCFGIDDCSLAALKHGCKSLKVMIIDIFLRLLKIEEFSHDIHISYLLVFKV